MNYRHKSLAVKSATSDIIYHMKTSIAAESKNSLKTNITNEALIIPSTNQNQQFLSVRVNTNINSPTKLPVNQSTIRYTYDWRDGVDYDKLCKSVLNRLQHDSEHNSIIHDGYPGGLGHKSISMSYSLIYGSILNRNYHIYLTDSLWNSLDTCLEEVKYDEKAAKQFPRGKVCSKKRPCCNIFHGVADLSDLTKRRDVVISDLRLHAKSLTSGKNGESLVKAGILQRGEGFGSLQRRFIKLFLNPSKEIKDIAVVQMNNTWKRKYTIGIQLRTGGDLADYHEGTMFLQENHVKLVHRYVTMAMAKLHTTPEFVTLFVSSDSSKAIDILSKTVDKRYDIVKSDSFVIGHSTSGANSPPIKRALLDLYVISHADAVLYTGCSSYGNLVYNIATTKHVVQLPCVAVARPYYRRK